MEVLGEGRAWDAGLYDARHAFVWQSGAGIFEWLAPQPGESVLDVGCGTGHLTARIADTGAHVVGLDSSPAMIESARREYPNLRWIVGDARDFSLASLQLQSPLDAIFSNATLHWVRPPRDFLSCAFDVLRSGGRLAAEFGGRGNVERVLSSIEAGLEAVGAKFDVRHNYFPSLGEYAGLCESAGLQVLRAEVFERPTPLQGEHGLRDWARMFRTEAIEAVPDTAREAFFAVMEDAARPHLLRDGGWLADYRRLRILALKEGAST